FAPQNPDGAADPVNGLREIIVGTGGEGLDLPNTLIIPNSEARISGVYGVLKLTLSDGSYSWQFVPVAGQTASDAGSATCHGSPVTGPVTPLVSAGYDLLTHPGDTVSLSVTFSDPGPRVCGGRQRVSKRLQRRLHQLLRPDLGPAQSPDPAGARQPRVQHAWGHGLFRLLRRGGG